MSNYSIAQVYASDKKGNSKIDLLLANEGIRRDANLDYTCVVYDDDYNAVATGSCFGDTLRCLAVSSAYQGAGLMNLVVSHLVEIQLNRGNAHLFLYTKRDAAKFFADLGFYEIIQAEEEIVFMENRRTGFADYLRKLEQHRKALPRVAALVINANPFSLGHLYLVEKAAKENDLLHLFVVSEDASLVPFPVRKELVIKGTAHISNICYHDTGPYIISNATFPSYFQKDSEAVIRSHAYLDLTIFSKIGAVLGINYRYVGEEPNSQVTGIYNQIMKSKLPEFGISCIEVPRIKNGHDVISASTVRKAIHDDNMDLLKALVPETTLQYFTSKEAAEIIKGIKNAEEIIHY